MQICSVLNVRAAKDALQYCVEVLEGLGLESRLGDFSEFWILVIFITAQYEAPLHSAGSDEALQQCYRKLDSRTGGVARDDLTDRPTVIIQVLLSGDPELKFKLFHVTSLNALQDGGLLRLTPPSGAEKLTQRNSLSDRSPSCPAHCLQ